MALGDTVTAPQYIETVGRRGYRFVGRPPAGIVPDASTVTLDGASPLVGRQQEVARLQQWLHRARQGERQLVFLCGEAGIGKTTLLHLFCHHLLDQPDIRICRGHCLEHVGAGEAYVPVFDVEQLGRGPEGEAVLALLRRVAPTCLAHLPALLPEAERELLQRQMAGATRTRMLLETDGVAAWPDGAVSGQYRFAHALVRQVAYERLGAGPRVGLHRRVGACMEASYGAQASTIAATLAVHFQHGRDPARAVYYLSLAAGQALARSAPREAIAHCTTGLTLLPTLPDPRERADRELALLLPLRTALIATQGYLAPDLPGVLTRARAVCQPAADHPQGLQMLEALVMFHTMRAELATACALAQEHLHLVRRQADAPRLAAVLHDLGFTCHMRGAFAEARRHLEEGIACCDTQPLAALCTAANLLNQSVLCRATVAWTLWYLGYPDQSLTRMQEALHLAEALHHPYSLAHAHYMAATLHYYRQEVEAVQAHAAALLALATTHGWPQYVAGGRILQGWVQVYQQQVEAGLTNLRQGLAAHRAIAALGRPAYQAYLARAYGQVGRVEEGLRLVEEALALSAQTGENDSDLVSRIAPVYPPCRGRDPEGGDGIARGIMHGSGRVVNKLTMPNSSIPGRHRWVLL